MRSFSLAPVVLSRLLHRHGRFGVGLLKCRCFERVHGHARFQAAFALWNPAEDLQWCGPAAIDAPPFAIGLFDNLGHRAGPVKVQIRIQPGAMKVIDRLGMLRTDVSEAYMFAHDRAVLRLHQTVVARAVRA